MELRSANKKRMLTTLLQYDIPVPLANTHELSICMLYTKQERSHDDNSTNTPLKKVTQNMPCTTHILLRNDLRRWDKGTF